MTALINPTLPIKREQLQTRNLPARSFSDGKQKKQLDCFDFCQWSLRKEYDFHNFIEPDGTMYMPTMDDLIADESL